MSEEFKDVRRELEESLREMEILKRKALRLEDENEHLVRISSKSRYFELFWSRTKLPLNWSNMKIVVFLDKKHQTDNNRL